MPHSAHARPLPPQYGYSALDVAYTHRRKRVLKKLQKHIDKSDSKVRKERFKPIHLQRVLHETDPGPVYSSDSE